MRCPECQREEKPFVTWDRLIGGMALPSGIRSYESYRGSEQIGILFTLARDQLQMRCEVSTHVLGWELRLNVSEELLQS